MAKTRRKMTAKQIKHFGTKRQRAALRAKRSRPKHRARTRTNPPKGGGRVISGYGSTVMNSGRKRHKNPGNHKIVINSARRKKRAVAKKNTAKRRRNPVPQILVWGAGNPAKRSKSVAGTKTRRRATAKRSTNAGRRRAPKKVIHHRRRSRGNPAGLGRPMDWVQGGAGVIAGVVVTRLVPQMLMGSSNTSYMGYAANAATAIGAGWLTHILFPRNAVLVTAVIAGGFAGLLSRIIADQTPFGQTLSLSGGLGDWSGLGLYQKANFANPPRIAGPRGPDSSMYTYGSGAAYAPASLGQAGSDSSLPC